MGAMAWTWPHEAPQRHQRGGRGPTAARQGPRPWRRPRALLGRHRRAAGGAREHGAAEPGRLGRGWRSDGDGMGMGKPPIFHEYSTSFRFFPCFSEGKCEEPPGFSQIFSGGNWRTSPEIGGWGEAKNEWRIIPFYRWLSGV